MIQPFVANGIYDITLCYISNREIQLKGIYREKNKGRIFTIYSVQHGYKVCYVEHMRCKMHDMQEDTDKRKVVYLEWNSIILSMIRERLHWKIRN